MEKKKIGFCFAQNSPKSCLPFLKIKLLTAMLLMVRESLMQCPVKVRICSIICTYGISTQRCTFLPISLDLMWCGLNLYRWINYKHFPFISP